MFDRKKETIDYNFSCLNPVDFELTLTLPCDNQIFTHILSKTLTKLNKKGYNTESVKELKHFDIDQRYYGLITTRSSSIIKQVKKEIEADGIDWQSYNLKKATMQKGLQNWTITLIFKGTYVDNRKW